MDSGSNCSAGRGEDKSYILIISDYTERPYLESTRAPYRLGGGKKADKKTPTRGRMGKNRTGVIGPDVRAL